MFAYVRVMYKKGGIIYCQINRHTVKFFYKNLVNLSYIYEGAFI